MGCLSELVATFEIGRGSYHRRVCPGGSRNSIRVPRSPTRCWLSSPLLLPGGPPRPVPRGSRALERLVPLQAPCHGQLPGSRGKGASRGMQKPALPSRGWYHPLQRQCPPTLDRAAMPRIVPGPIFGAILPWTSTAPPRSQEALAPVSTIVIACWQGYAFSREIPHPMVQAFACQNCCSLLPPLLAGGDRRRWSGFSSICLLQAKQRYWYNLLVRWEQEIIHPAAFNSSRSGFAHPHPLVHSSIQGCPYLGRVWAKAGPGNTICQVWFFLLLFKASSRLPGRGTKRFPHLDIVVYMTLISCHYQEKDSVTPCCRGAGMYRRVCVWGVYVPKMLFSWRRQPKAAPRAPSTTVGWKTANTGALKWLL